MPEAASPDENEPRKPSRLLLIAITSLFIQQTFATMCRLVLPVLAPAISADLGLNPALVGAYSGILSFAGMVLAVGVGGFIERFGAWRMCQVTLATSAAAMFLAAPGFLPLFAVSAVLVGPAPGVSTPASSHVLARHCPLKWAPFFFSIKQTAVPAGGLLVGFLVPFLALRFGWRGAFVAIGLLFVALALALQPLRARFDGDRHPLHRSFLADAGTTLKLVTTNPQMRELLLAAFAFVGLQILFDSFLVTCLVNGHGYPLTVAGGVFATGQGVAVATRVLWGWVAGTLMTSRRVLAILGLIMAGASAALGLSGSDWPLPAIIAVTIVYTATAFSWNGVLLAEVARLAPAGRVGATTGGLTVFTMCSATLYPLAFAAILAATGSYSAGFLIAALPALVAGLRLARPPRGAAPAAE